MRVKWIHFYIVLAVCDLCIIAAGLWLYRHTYSTFTGWRDYIGETNARQSHLALLGRELLLLNAPGNDVFRTRNIRDEYSRYLTRKAHIQSLRGDGLFSSTDLDPFWTEVQAMCAEADRIFGALQIEDDAASGAALAAEAWTKAGEHMARMDDRQVRGMQWLAIRQDALIRESSVTMKRYDNEIESQARMQIGLIPGVLLALLGMLWYGRKLQRADEALILERARVEHERRERLASIGELCSGVAHGIQNPLAAIASSAELIRDLGVSDSASRQRVTDILTECAQLSQRVKRLLHFARADARPRQPVRVQDVLSQVLHELQPRFDDRRLVIVRDMAADPLTVMADSDELATVCIELLANALDHSPDGMEVRVRAAMSNDSVVLEVSDNGPGVPPNAREHVFELFYTTKPGGSGIGLASCKRIVTGLDGTIELLPATGRGSTFRVTLPRHRPQHGDGDGASNRGFAAHS